MTILLGSNMYTVEFRHVTKLGRRPLLRKAPVKAVTTCVVIGLGPDYNPMLIAIDNAICSEADNFSRRVGRMRSLRKLLDRCGALKNVHAELWARYLLATAQRPVVVKDIPGLEAVEALKNTPEAIDKRQRRQKFGRYAE